MWKGLVSRSFWLSSSKAAEVVNTATGETMLLVATELGPNATTPRGLREAEDYWITMKVRPRKPTPQANVLLPA